MPLALGRAASHTDALTLQTFVFEKQADYDLMMHEINDQEFHGRRLRINGAQLAPGVTMSNFAREMPQEFKDWGFDCMAIDLIEGPELVLAWLCHAHNLHRIVSGREKSQPV